MQIAADALAGRTRRRWPRRVALVLFLGGLGLLLLVQALKLGDLRQAAEYPGGTAPLAGRLRVVSWNIAKGLEDDFEAQLERLLAEEDPDLLLLQEATTETGALFGERGAHFARSFRIPGLWATGTLTAARREPLRAFAVPTTLDEVIVATPKACVVTEYALARRGTLLVANVHGLNTPDEWLLEEQLDELADRLEEHDGPMVVGGDFNTWSQARLEVLSAFANRLALREVRGFPTGRRTAETGRWTGLLERFGVDPTLPLDRMLYRGLERVEARLREDLRASDHVALVVDFRIP